MPLLEAVTDVVAKGGWVMWPLLGGTFLLWSGLGYRVLSVQGGRLTTWMAWVLTGARPFRWGDLTALLGLHRQRDPLSLDELLEGTAAGLPGYGVLGVAATRATTEMARGPAALRGRLTLGLDPLRDQMSRFSGVVRMVVMLAPLMGLLGTVGGMIETFDSLADMSLFSQSGGIAGGISEALFTTQMGLAVAIPGLIVGRLIDRRQQQLEDALDRLSDLCCANMGEAA